MIEKCLLYVEDDNDIRDDLADFLKTRVSKVFTAKDGQEGLDIFRKEKPDFIVTDIRMPRMSGLDMIREIRAGNRKIPTIVTSAYSDSEYLLEAINIGVNQFLLKPIDLSKLEKSLFVCAEMLDDPCA
jgi:YesN/AraC family two-component response regulator